MVECEILASGDLRVTADDETRAWIDGDYSGGVGGYRTAGQAVAALLAKVGA